MVQKFIFIAIFTVNAILFLIFYITHKFPTALMLIHFFTLMLLWALMINPKEIYKSIQKNRLDIVLIACLFWAALIIRLYKVEEITAGMWGDEITIAISGEQVLSSREFTPFIDVNYGHPTPLLYLEGISTRLLGATLTAVRLPSIFFGVMDVVLFYVFLRLFFKRPIAFATALIMAFSYPHVVVSRLAYEITAFIFFQILATIFLYLCYKTNKTRYYLGIGLTLGAGLYAYVGFRTFVIAFLMLSAVLLMRKKDIVKNKIVHFILIITTLFISIAPLLSFSLLHKDLVLARAKSLSVFGQNLPRDEVVKEIQGATARLSYLFFFSGDPNPRQNPSGVSMFDIITVLFSIVGLVFLYKVNRNLFFVSLFLTVPSIVNDIFSLEQIPKHHYYGLGHPNTLRIAGIIPIVYFWLAYGIMSIKAVYPRACVVIVGIIIIINWFFYFNQASINHKFYAYNYEFNSARMLNVANAINKSKALDAYLSPSFLNDQRVIYFSRKNVRLKTFNLTNEQDALSIIKSSQLTIFDTRIDKTLAKTFVKIIKYYKEKQGMFNLEVLANPLGGADAIIFSKAK